MSDIERWLADHAISIQSLAELLEGLSERLVAEGVPLIRCNISMSVVNPLFRARFLTWKPRVPLLEGTIPHGLDPVTLAQSPIGSCISRANNPGTGVWMCPASMSSAFWMTSPPWAGRISSRRFTVSITRISAGAWCGSDVCASEA